MFWLKIRHKLAKNTFLGNLYRLKYEESDLIYNPLDLNKDYYEKIAKIGDKELEHQIGRLTNFKQILAEIDKDNISGDMIEFGTWKGFSLLWLAYLAERLGIWKKKLVGIDCFSGLPNDEGVFKKGAFADTSFESCRDNIFRNKNLYEFTKKNIYIEKYFFNQQKGIGERLKEIGVSKFCLVHIDSDISSSALEIFSLLNSFDLLNKDCYILFDDYGCVDSYSQTVDSLMLKMSSNWNIQVHSSTRFTKNYKLTKK